MRTIVYMLKLIVVVLGGAQSVSEVPGDTISAVLEQIRTAIANKKDLPAATADDVGKAVVVGESGDYELGDAGGGVQPVTVTVDTANHTWSGATWAELVDAFNHGCAFVFDGDHKIQLVDLYADRTTHLQSAALVTFEDLAGTAFTVYYTIGTDSASVTAYHWQATSN
ncbi:MAG: hypothetical protein IKO68_08270 [Oscillospiraceae bacterium]|nr:hypothetical protein [Oscillospiraceae bacterium]